jgi:hypothetical protein
MEGLTLFKTPSIYLVIERYLEWRDFLHIIQTCRELYYNWVSKDPIRWKDLKLPLFIYKYILGYEYTKTNNPTQSVREIALESIISNNAYYYYPCMGRCGNRFIYMHSVVSHDLTYALCTECARFDRSCFLKRHLIKNKLTKDPQTYLIDYIIALVGVEKFTENRNKIFELWMTVCSPFLIRQEGWAIEIYSIEQVEKYAKELLDKMSL